MDVAGVALVLVALELPDKSAALVAVEHPADGADGWVGEGAHGSREKLWVHPAVGVLDEDEIRVEQIGEQVVERLVQRPGLLRRVRRGVNTSAR